MFPHVSARLCEHLHVPNRFHTFPSLTIRFRASPQISEVFRALSLVSTAYFLLAFVPTITLLFFRDFASFVTFPLISSFFQCASISFHRNSRVSTRSHVFHEFHRKSESSVEIHAHPQFSARTKMFPRLPTGILAFPQVPTRFLAFPGAPSRIPVYLPVTTCFRARLHSPQTLTRFPGLADASAIFSRSSSRLRPPSH